MGDAKLALYSNTQQEQSWCLPREHVKTTLKPAFHKKRFCCQSRGTARACCSLNCGHPTPVSLHSFTANSWIVWPITFNISGRTKSHPLPPREHQTPRCKHHLPEAAWAKLGSAHPSTVEKSPCILQHSSATGPGQCPAVHDLLQQRLLESGIRQCKENWCTGIIRIWKEEAEPAGIKRERDDYQLQLCLNPTYRSKGERHFLMNCAMFDNRTNASSMEDNRKAKRVRMEVRRGGGGKVGRTTETFSASDSSVSNHHLLKGR